MSIVEFELPDELKDTTYETILTGMLSRIDSKYDKLEGGFVHDMISPCALEASELLNFWLALGLKMNFHMYATGRWLDLHARDCGLSRKAATHAYSILNITTSKAVTLPAGFVFSVPAEGTELAIDFETLVEQRCANAGEHLVEVRAVLAGKSSNVAAGSITIMKTPLKGIEQITNKNQVTGGTEAESDSSLRQRIDDFYAGHGHSYVGNKSDYIRWAKQIDGVAFANCIPCYDGPNTVKLIIADENGDGADEHKLRAVREYIFGEDHNDLSRLAPIGITKYAVVAPETQKITIKFDGKLTASETYVKSQITQKMTEYFRTLADEDNVYGELKYQKVSAILSGVAGLEDFRNLRIGAGSSEASELGVDNISFTAEQIPVISVADVMINSW